MGAYLTPREKKKRLPSIFELTELVDVSLAPGTIAGPSSSSPGSGIALRILHEQIREPVVRR